MGNKILGTDIAGILNDALGAGMLPGTLTQYTLGARTTGQLSGGRARQSKTHSFRGIFDKLATKYVDDTVVKAGDRAVLILGDSISPAAVPGEGDDILLEGDTVKVVALLERDPDAATYLLAVRG